MEKRNRSEGKAGSSVAECSSPASLTFRMRSLEETTSTNDEIKRAIRAGEPEGLAVRARRQIAGYGRQGRTWVSPDGGLYMSLLLRPHVSPEVLPTLSLVAGLAVRRALVGFAEGALSGSEAGLSDSEAGSSHALVATCGDPSSSRPSAADCIRVKWPNDVVLLHGVSREASVHDASVVREFSKLCGISLEACAGGVCVGIGVNVVSFGTGSSVGGKNAPAYLGDLAPTLVERPTDEALGLVADAVLAAFAPLYSAWANAGFAPCVAEYNEHALLTGRRISVVDRAGDPLASGIVCAVDETGRLLLRDGEGREIPVTSGEAHIL